MIISLNYQFVYADAAAEDLQMMNMPKGKINGCLYNKLHIVMIDSRVNNLRLHCKSGDDDLGDVWRNAGEEFSISFCLNIWKTTLYFCHFYWESKQKVFDVYAMERGNDPDYCYTSQFFGQVECRWMVKDDGFYIARYPGPGQTSLTWIKRFDWD
ncbi:hypothetical protein QVD17_01969 [Tagetes erecta]|uniref:S-protein homolog n=1 Tax=Tagetes erecta TaxID=13708 RepID=A0AAD8LBJ5_TARER|nr:hypothetical protein QVD17_01969 [Tagetes erecta]